MNLRVLLLVAPVFLVVIAPSSYLAVVSSAYVGSMVDRGLLVLLSLGTLGLLSAILNVRIFLLFAMLILFAAPYEVIHIAIFRDSVSMGMLNCALDTNPLEAREMLGDYAPMILLSFLLPAYSLFAFFRVPKKMGMPSRIRMILIALSCLPFLLLGMRFWHWGYRGKVLYDNCRASLSQTFPLGTVLKLHESLSARLHGRLRNAAVKSFHWNAVPGGARDTGTIILIIGESSRSDHWQLNGYQRQTNPRLSLDSSVISFQNVSSSANITNESISELLTLATPTEPQLFETTSSLLKAFSEAGWKTWWISNQGAFSAVDAKQSQISKEADVSIFLPHMIEGPLSHQDGDLLPLLDSALSSTSTRKLIVVHTMGSHFRYYYRYPDQFNIFASKVNFEKLTNASQSYKSAIINSYDNSIVYTDWILGEILKRMYSKAEKIVAIYISDHGESLFDGSMTNAGHGSPNPFKNEFQIPLIFSANSSWKASNPEKLQQLKLRVNDPISSEAILPTLFELADLQTPYVLSKNSLTSPDWQPAQRFVTTTAGRVRTFEELPQ